jgi:hypothetical protein
VQHGAEQLRQSAQFAQCPAEKELSDISRLCFSVFSVETED